MQPGMRNTASLFFSPEDPFHHIPFMDVSSFSTEKGFVFRYYLPGTVQKNPRYLYGLLNSPTSSYSVLSHRPFSFSDSYLVPTRLFIPYIQKENSLISWFVTVPFDPLHSPDSQALFTCNPSLLLHFPFLRLSMSISFCTPLLYSTSNPALLKLRRWIYT